MKKTIIFATVLAMLLLMMAGCGSTATPQADNPPAPAENQSEQSSQAAPEQAPAADGKIKIGISFYQLSGEFNASERDAIYAYMDEMNLNDSVEIMFMDADYDAVKQNEQVDSLIQAGCQAIIMNAGDKDAQVSAVEAAAKANIPMIELTSATEATDLRTSYVGSEDIVSGRMLAEELCKRLEGGKGNLVILHGPTGITPEIRRHEGLHEILAGYPDIEIVAEKVCNWSRAEAMSAVENILQSGMDVDIIFAENDEMAMGALMAIQGSNYSKRIILGGIDAIPDAVQAVLDGGLDCTVFQDAVTQAKTALEVAIKAAKGESIDKLYDIPYKLVLQQNATEFLPK